MCIFLILPGIIVMSLGKMKRHLCVALCIIIIHQLSAVSIYPFDDSEGESFTSMILFVHFLDRHFKMV